MKEHSAKMGIAYKEAKETHYWIRLLKETENLINDVEELMKTIGRIQISTKQS